MMTNRKKTMFATQFFRGLLKKAIEHYIILPLANLVTSGQIQGVDAVTVDIVDGSWKFAAACSCEACKCGDSASCCREASRMTP